MHLDKTKQPYVPVRALVAVETAAPEIYSYLAPLALQPLLAVGQAVLVPLGRRQAIGYVLALKTDPLPENFPLVKLKSILEIVRTEPLFGSSLAKLINFTSSYYLYPPGLCAKEILPGGLSPQTEKAITLIDGQDTSRLPMLGAETELITKLKEVAPNPIPIKELEKEGFGSAIKKITAEGFAKNVWRVKGRGPKPQYEWWLGPAPEPPASPRRLGAKEQALWELAKKGPAKPLSYYRAFLPNPLPQARSLSAKGLTVLTQKEIIRDDPERALFQHTPQILQPTADQAQALLEINQALNGKTYKGFLLFGVTGSGKTEVYMRAAEQALAQGREVLWLAPEIALTMGLEGQLKSRLGSDRVAVLHSGLTPGQRHDQWLKIRRGQAPIVLGARSAVFAPLENLGLVVVDEEHDGAYKQDDGLRYNGRDLAVWRAREADAAVILGSATPSLESYQATLDGRFKLLKMAGRTGQAILPKVEIIDQRQEPGRRRQVLSPPLKKKLAETFQRNEQALLFINRRGLSNLPLCLACGEAMKCPHCSRNLTLHGPDKPDLADDTAAPAADLEGQTLVCHSCGYRADPPSACPACQSPLFRYFGVGTEKLLKMAEELFPEARGSRLDADAMRHKGGLKKILNAFVEGRLNLLVGTQMAAKGHDFPRLTLVGVVEADLGLNLPDFRAAERTFQLLSQVSGRAGRSKAAGQVVIQTLNPHHYALAAAANHDYEEFFAKEIALRAELGYPPFARLALIRLIGPDESRLERLADEAGECGRKLLDAFEGQIDLFGPAPSPVARLKDNYRWQIMIRSFSISARHKFLSCWLPEIRSGLPKEIRLTVDIDPYHLL